MIIGIGIDIIQNERIAQSLERFGDRFVHRLFTDVEAKYCEDSAKPEIHYAARFAAKEATFKALGTGWSHGIRWKDVEVCRLPSGQPKLQLYGEALKYSTAIGVKKFFVSLTHDQAVSAAVVILET